MHTDTRTQRLAQLGQSVWIDYLSRDLLESGELARLVAEDGVVGVTSNPTIFQHAISHGEAYNQRLDALGAPAELKGKLGIANARLAYARYRELFSSENEPWAELQVAGAHPQRCLWASTSTKNPAYRDVLYVEELIGPETVNTLPEPTLLAFQDHGRVTETLTEGLDEAGRLLERLGKVGVDYREVVETLEREGVEKFSASFAALLAGLEVKMHALEQTVGGRR